MLLQPQRNFLAQVDIANGWQPASRIEGVGRHKKRPQVSGHECVANKIARLVVLDCMHLQCLADGNQSICSNWSIASKVQ
jgi:hypothetical protein